MIFGKVKIPEYEDSWNSYFTNIEGHHASVFFNMGLKKVAPVKSFPALLAVNMQYLDHDENGLPTAEQAEILFQIEDALTQALEQDIGALYSGRMTYHMQREFYFYLPGNKSVRQEARSLVEGIFASFLDFAFTTDCGEDENWEHFLERLYPSEEERQTMNNMSLLTVLAEQGDSLEQPRIVQHWCYFRGDNVRALFRGEVEQMGFEVAADHFHDDESELPYSITFRRKDQIGFRDINALTLPLYHLAKKYNGYYDGWEVPVLKDGGGVES